MSDRSAIEIHGISKRYLLGEGPAVGGLLREAIARPFDLIRNRRREELWALQDIHLDVPMGEVVGLIGANGAGKSTLLKVLARVTDPTAGHAILRGRVGSLLEVGTGFHPELTGRENIYLNGAILGMKRAEIRSQFDEIVEFAELSTFVDTPVKRYSSGMYVRLAFSIAAHLRTDILLVDEVLAVGDLRFQKRCLGRLGEVARTGRTVLFVSHNLASVEQLCSRSVLLEGGKVTDEGNTSEIVGRYISSSDVSETAVDTTSLAREGTGAVVITGIEILAADEEATVDSVEVLMSFRVRMRFEVNRPLLEPRFGLAVVTERHERVFMADSREGGLEVGLLQHQGQVECLIHRPNLLPGVYSFDLWIEELGYADYIRGVGRLHVTIPQDHPMKALLSRPDRGLVVMDCDWNLLHQEDQ